MKLSFEVLVNLTMKFDENNNNRISNKGSTVRGQTCLLSLPSNILIKSIKEKS